MNEPKLASPFAKLFARPTASQAEGPGQAAAAAPASMPRAPAAARAALSAGASRASLASAPHGNLLPVMHAAASSLSAGFAGGFDDGPLPQPDPQWVVNGLLPFVLNEKGVASINFDELLRCATDIDPVMYGELCTQLESIEMQVAMGQDVMPGFDDRHDALIRVLQACSWTMDPDEGVVPKPAHDRASSRS